MSKASSRCLTTAAIAACVALSIASPAQAGPGDSDPTFSGFAGPFGFGGDTESATSVAIQPNGKVVVAGGSASHDQDGNPISAASGLARLNADGSFDTSFDGDGKLSDPRLPSGADVAVPAARIPFSPRGDPSGARPLSHRWLARLRVLHRRQDRVLQRCGRARAPGRREDRGGGDDLGVPLRLRDPGRRDAVAGRSGRRQRGTERASGSAAAGSRATSTAPDQAIPTARSRATTGSSATARARPAQKGGATARERSASRCCG